MANVEIQGKHITLSNSQKFDVIQDTLAKSGEFNLVQVCKEKSVFERVAPVKTLMFVPAPSENVTIVFDNHITKVVCESIEDTTYNKTYGGGEWTTSGQTVNGIYDQDLTYTVTLQSGYVIDTVTSTEYDGLTVSSDGLSFSGYATTGNDCTITITSKANHKSKTLTSRVVNKHDTSTNWAKATSFIPKAGEIVVYDDLKKIKVGDGTTTVGSLDFIGGGSSGSGDVTTSGNNVFTGTNTFAQAATFTSGIKNHSTLTFTPAGGDPDPTSVAPYAIYNYGSIQLKAPGISGTDKVRTLTLPTSTSGTLALTSDIPTKTSQLTNDSNFADKTANNTFTGQNSFSGETTISGTLNAGEAIFSDVATFDEVAEFGSSPIITDAVVGDSKPGLWLRGTDAEQPYYIKLCAEASEITSDYDLKIPCRDGTIATTDQIPTINVSESKSNSVGLTVTSISPQTGTNYIVNFPYIKLSTPITATFSAAPNNYTKTMKSILTAASDSCSTSSAVFELYLSAMFYSQNTGYVSIYSDLYSANTHDDACVSGYARNFRGSFTIPISYGGTLTITKTSGKTTESISSGEITIWGYRRIR